MTNRQFSERMIIDMILYGNEKAVEEVMKYKALAFSENYEQFMTTYTKYFQEEEKEND